MLSLERLQEVAQTVKPLQTLWTLCGDDIYSVGVNKNEVTVQLAWGNPDLLVPLAEAGHHYTVWSGKPLDGGRWYHLRVLIDGVWFWNAVDAEIGQRLLDALNEKAQAAATA